MPNEVFILMSEGLMSPNFMVGDSSGEQVGRISYKLLGRDGSIHYPQDVPYTARQCLSLKTDRYDLVDETRLKAGASEDDSIVARAHRIWDFTAQTRWVVEGYGFKLCLWMGSYTVLLGKYNVSFRVLLYDGSDHEGQCLGMVTSIEAPSRDFNLTFDSSVPGPLRLFCFTMMMHYLRSGDF